MHFSLRGGVALQPSGRGGETHRGDDLSLSFELERIEVDQGGTRRRSPTLGALRDSWGSLSGLTEKSRAVLTSHTLVSRFGGFDALWSFGTGDESGSRWPRAFLSGEATSSGVVNASRPAPERARSVQRTLRCLVGRRETPLGVPFGEPLEKSASDVGGT